MSRHVDDAVLVQHGVLREQPSPPPPRPSRLGVGHRPRRASRMKMRPRGRRILTRVTPSPTSTTSPTPSDSGDHRQARLGIVKPLDDHQIAIVQRPRPHVEHDLARPRPGSGRSTTCRLSRPKLFCISTTFMADLRGHRGNRFHYGDRIGRFGPLATHTGPSSQVITIVPPIPDVAESPSFWSRIR